MKLKRVSYRQLNSRQKENFNYQKLAAILADYGFVTLRLSDDWRGADFIAQHVDGQTFLRVQLKSRLAFQKKYLGKGIWIAFSYASVWYLYPHDELLRKVLSATSISRTRSWSERGGYSFGRPPKAVQPFLVRYRIG